MGQSAGNCAGAGGWEGKEGHTASASPHSGVVGGAKKAPALYSTHTPPTPPQPQGRGSRRHPGHQMGGGSHSICGGDDSFLQPSRICPLPPVPRTSPIMSLHAVARRGQPNGWLLPHHTTPPSPLPPPRGHPSSPQTRLVVRLKARPLTPASGGLLLPQDWVRDSLPGPPTQVGPLGAGGLQPGLGAHSAVNTLLGQGKLGAGTKRGHRDPSHHQ